MEDPVVRIMLILIFILLLLKCICSQMKIFLANKKRSQSKSANVAINVGQPGKCPAEVFINGHKMEGNCFRIQNGKVQVTKMDEEEQKMFTNFRQNFANFQTPQSINIKGTLGKEFTIYGGSTGFFSNQQQCQKEKESSPGAEEKFHMKIV